MDSLDADTLHKQGSSADSVLMLSEILTRAGYATGLYTSPHLFRINERMKVNGVDISDDELARLAEQVKPLVEKMADPPTEFERITAMALGDDRKARQMFARAMEVFEKTEELPGRSLAEAYTAYYAAQDGRYASAVELLAVSWDSASKLSSLVEQGIRDSVLARLRRQLDQDHALGNELDHYLYRPLDIYCHRGMQRLRGVKGAYESEQLEDCLKYSVRQAKPLTVENLYSKNKNFMTE